MNVALKLIPNTVCRNSLGVNEMEMSLAEQANWWNQAAINNAATAILSNESNWDIADFFETGHVWLSQHAEFVRQFGVELGGQTSLDFGCGMGRMTNALGRLYERSVGIDISSEMIARATRTAPDPNLEFKLVTGYPLPFVHNTFDLVYSTIVVQHISEPHNLEYIREFFRVTKPGGYVLFDAPARALPNRDPGPGIFISPEAEVRRIGGLFADWVGDREYPATSTYHLQYLFRKR